MTVLYKKILVAVDGSEPAEKAFLTAASLAAQLNSDLVVAHVLDVRSYSVIEAYDLSVDERMKTYAEQLLFDCKAKAEELGVKNIELILDYGSPRTKIAKDIARNVGADLIVCGASGMSAVERFILGSVSEGIARYANCNVLVVRNEEK